MLLHKRQKTTQRTFSLISCFRAVDQVDYTSAFEHMITFVMPFDGCSITALNGVRQGSTIAVAPDLFLNRFGLKKRSGATVLPYGLDRGPHHRAMFAGCEYR